MKKLIFLIFAIMGMTLSVVSAQAQSCVIPRISKYGMTEADLRALVPQMDSKSENIKAQGSYAQTLFLFTNKDFVQILVPGIKSIETKVYKNEEGQVVRSEKITKFTSDDRTSSESKYSKYTNSSAGYDDYAWEPPKFSLNGNINDYVETETLELLDDDSAGFILKRTVKVDFQNEIYAYGQEPKIVQSVMDKMLYGYIIDKKRFYTNVLYNNDFEFTEDIQLNSVGFISQISFKDKIYHCFDSKTMFVQSGNKLTEVFQYDNKLWGSWDQVSHNIMQFSQKIDGNKIMTATTLKEYTFKSQQNFSDGMKKVVYNVKSGGSISEEIIDYIIPVVPFATPLNAYVVRL